MMMEVSISGRHMDITPQIREAVHTKIGQLNRYFNELDRAEVHFDEERNPSIKDSEVCECEVILSGHGHRIHCKVHASDPLTAIDMAEAKLTRQIRKLRTKLLNRYQGRGETIRGSKSVE